MSWPRRTARIDRQALRCRVPVAETVSIFDVSLGNPQKAGFKPAFEKEADGKPQGGRQPLIPRSYA
jgi:hypothetical protein